LINAPIVRIDDIFFLDPFMGSFSPEFAGNYPALTELQNHDSPRQRV
jgi:hypothetical protein